MTIKARAIVGMVVGLLAMASPVRAHHGAAGYDSTRLTVLKATITEFVWMNPHTLIKFDAAGEHGVVRHWTVEASPPSILVERGWSRNSLKPGWVVIMYFNAAQNGAPTGLMRKAVLPNGEDLWAYPPPELTEKPTIGHK